MIRESVLASARRGVLYVRGQRSVSWYVKRGLRIGDRCELEPGFMLDPSHCWLIEIGDDVTFAPDVHVIAHDASTKAGVGYTRVAPVTIGSRVFVGTRATILPGAAIGDDVVIGAASVVTGTIPPDSVAVGNPARVLCSLESYRTRVRERFASAPRFEQPWTVGGGITEAMKGQMTAQLAAAGEGFVL